MTTAVARVAYSVPGAAEFTGVSERTISDAIRDGDLRAHTLSDKAKSKKLIRHQDLDDWVQSLPVWEPDRD